MHAKHDCKEELRRAGSRATPGRLAILKVIERASEPLTAGEMWSRLHSLDQVTLYRALDALTSAGLLRKGMRGRTAHYSYARKPHHHHLVCADCGFAAMCAVC